MENKKLLAAVLLALSLFPTLASAEDAPVAPEIGEGKLTVGEIQRYKNEQSKLKNISAVNELRKKLITDATPPKPAVDEKAVAAEAAAVALSTQSFATPAPEFCSSYHALLIRGTGDNRSALIAGSNGAETSVKAGTVLPDGCVIEKIDNQSLQVREPVKGKKAKRKGKLHTVVLGTDFSSDNDKGNNNGFGGNMPPVPPMPAGLPQQPPRIETTTMLPKPYSSY